MSEVWKATYNKDPERWRARSRAWSEANPEKRALAQKKSDIKHAYGLDWVIYQKMVDSQGGKCAICGESSPLEVDHDHTTGKVRELLCTCCNRALGLMRESVSIFQGAITYVLRHKQKAD